MPLTSLPDTHRILIADDHPAIRIFLSHLITTTINSGFLIDETATLADLSVLIKKNRYDLAILDIHLEDGTTLTELPYIKLQQPDMKILFFSVCPEDIYAQRIIQMGALGFVNKKAGESEIRDAINRVLNGKRYLSQDFLFALLSSPELGFQKDSNPFLLLSAREFEVFTLLLDGKSNKDISNMINLSASTVSTHKSRIFERLNVSSDVELSQLAASYGITAL